MPLIMAGPSVPAGRRVRSNTALVGVLPTLGETAAGPGWDGYPHVPDGQSRWPLLAAEDDARVAVSEFLSEGVAAPCVMLRRGRWKLTTVDHDPSRLFHMDDDPDGVRDLNADPGHADVLRDLMAEVVQRWDMGRLKREIVVSAPTWVETELMRRNVAQVVAREGGARTLEDATADIARQ